MTTFSDNASSTLSTASTHSSAQLLGSCLMEEEFRCTEFRTSLLV